MAHLFVAYDRADFPAAQAFATTLKQLGYDVLWDAEGGEDAPARALDAIKASACVVALWSPRSTASGHVNFEAAAAAALGKLISVKIDGEAVPRPLSHLPAINLAHWDYRSVSPEVETLFTALERAARKKPNRANWMRLTGQVRDAPPPPQPKPRAGAKPQPEKRPPARNLAIAPGRILRWSAGAVGAAVVAVGMFYLGSELGRGFKFTPPTTPTSAAATFASPEPVVVQTAAPVAPVFAREENLVPLDELERYAWQEVARRLAQRLGDSGAEALRARAAEGSPAAQVEICIAHLRGIDGFPGDGAHSACLASAAQNHPAAQYLVWVTRERLAVDAPEARQHLVASAAQGWAPAQQLLASYYRNAGEGFARDHTQARAMLSVAAEKGYPRAMLDLSIAYLRGGGEEDRTQAKTYLQRVMADREFSELCRPARATLVSLGEDPPRCRS